MNLQDYRDRHKGRPGFVAGSGCSLRHIEPGQLDGQIIIAVNGAILKFPKAQYFFSCDARVTLTKAWLTVKSSNAEIVINKFGGDFRVFDEQTGVSYKEGIGEDRIKYFDREKIKTMHQSATKLIFGTCSVHPAVHFAYIIGLSPIYLLGCDCRLEEGNKYFTDFEGQPDNGFIKPEYAKFVAEEGVDILSYFTNTWLDLALCNKHVKIINCSQGNLDCFPRMNLSEALYANR